MARVERGRPTYNTLNARRMLQRLIPAHLREEPEPEPQPEFQTKGLNALRNVTRILAGQAPKADPSEGIDAAEFVRRERVGRC